MLELETPHGIARVRLDQAESPSAALVLGHGAGGGIDSPDLQGAAGAARDAGLSVALVEQPYRVAGRRTPAPAAQLDAAWGSVVSQLPFAGLALIAGGRPPGGAVAWRAPGAGGAAAGAPRGRAWRAGPPPRWARARSSASRSLSTRRAGPRRAASPSSTPSRCRPWSSRASATRLGCRRRGRGGRSLRSPARTRCVA